MATSKVLIVDQEPQRLRETARLLQSAKYQVLGASSGEECLRTAREKQPDMILLDAALPDVSGIDLAKQLKQDPELADVYVAVVLPEDVASPIRARALENGADAYLLRELPKREFAARLDALLRRASSEQAMRTSLAKWRRLLNAINDAVYIVNTEHRIVDCNVALAKMFGKAPSEVIGTPCHTLIHGSSKPIANCLHKRVSETKRRETLVVPMDDVWLQVAVDPLLDENDQLIGSVHILSDVTERKAQEEALHQARSDLLKRLEEQRAANAKTEETLQAEVAARQEVEQALEQARAKMEKQAENNLTALARVDGALKEQQSRGQALQEELERTQQQVLEYEASLARTQEQFTLESTERQRAEQDRKQLQEALLSQAAEREQAERVLNELRAKLKDETAQRERLQLALDQALQQLDEHRQQVARGEEALHTVAAEFEQAKLKLSDAQTKLTVDQEALQTREAEAQRLAEEYQAARSDWEQQSGRYHEALAQAAEALQAQVAGRKQVEDELRAARKQAEELRVALRETRDMLHQEQLDRQRLTSELNKAQAEMVKQTEQLKGQLDRTERALQAKVAEALQLQGQLETDMARRKRAEEALRAATDLLYEWDVDSGQMVFFSDEGGKLSGEAGGLPKTVHEFLQDIHPEDRQRIDQAMERHLTDAEPFAEEYRMLRGDGRVSYWQATGKAVRDEDGKPVKWVGSAAEITSRRLAEQREQERAERVAEQQRMDAVARLANGLARRVNEWMTVVIGGSEVAKAQVEPSHPVHKELDSIQKTARQTVGWTRKLLSISGGQLVQRQRLDVNEFLAGRVQALQRLLGDDIALQLNRGSGLKPVLADADALERALLNLAETARHAMPDGGTLRIDTEAVVVDEDACATHPRARAGQHVRIRVADSGPGIDAQLLAHIFEPYVLAPAEDDSDGLALAVVHGIVTQHDGWIEASSEPDNGTRFDIYLPVHSKR